MTMISEFTTTTPPPATGNTDCWIDLRDTRNGYEIRSEWEMTASSGLKRVFLTFTSLCAWLSAICVALAEATGVMAVPAENALVGAGFLAILGGALMIAARKPRDRAVLIDQVDQTLNDLLSGPDGQIIKTSVKFSQIERLVARQIQEEPARFQLMATIAGQATPITLAFGTRHQIEMLRMRIEMDIRLAA